jgi:hypothetical protein
MSGRTRNKTKPQPKPQPGPKPSPKAEATATPAADDLTQATAPEEFRRAITKDPYASIYRFDFDAARGTTPLPKDSLPVGGDAVPRDGYYFDVDGMVVNYYRGGTIFPKYAPISGAGGRYFFVTNNRNATTSDLLWILLRSGFDGNVLEIYVQ